MGLAKLESTRVPKYFPGHGWHSGTAMSFCRPHFLIKYRDGDTEDLLGYQLARFASSFSSRSSAWRGLRTS